MYDVEQPGKGNEAEGGRREMGLALEAQRRHTSDVPDDVLVLQLLEQTDFADGCARHALIFCL